jgi:hypothetical protein
MGVWVRTPGQGPPQRCTGDGSTLRRLPDTQPPGARQGCQAGRSSARLATPGSHVTLGRHTHVLPNRRQNRPAKAGGQAWSKRTRALGHGCPLPGSAPRRGRGGPHDPTGTNQRPSGTVPPHASSRGTGSSLRAGCQPHAWWWGGMAPEAKAAGKARGDADGRPVGWQGEGPVGVHTACTRHDVRCRPGQISRGPKSHGRSASANRASPEPVVMATARRSTSSSDS